MRRAIIAIALAVVAPAGATGCSSSADSSSGSITLPHASCGQADGYNLGAKTQLVTAYRGALTCFTTAARTCKAVGLGVRQRGTDTGTLYVFAIASSGTPGYCTVTEYKQRYSAIAIGDQAVSTFHCFETAVTSQGVALACEGPAAQDDTVFIPATLNVPGQRSPGS
jgi:hypothetical protein